MIPNGRAVKHVFEAHVPLATRSTPASILTHLRNVLTGWGAPVRFFLDRPTPDFGSCEGENTAKI